MANVNTSLSRGGISERNIPGMSVIAFLSKIKGSRQKVVQPSVFRPELGTKRVLSLRGLRQQIKFLQRQRKFVPTGFETVTLLTTGLSDVIFTFSISILFLFYCPVLQRPLFVLMVAAMVLSGTMVSDASTSYCYRKYERCLDKANNSSPRAKIGKALLKVWCLDKYDECL